MSYQLALTNSQKLELDIRLNDPYDILEEKDMDYGFIQRKIYELEGRRHATKSNGKSKTK